MNIFGRKEQNRQSANPPPEQTDIQKNERWAQQFADPEGTYHWTPSNAPISRTHLPPQQEVPTISFEEIEAHKRYILELAKFKKTLEGNTPDEIVIKAFQAHQRAIEKRGKGN